MSQKLSDDDRRAIDLLLDHGANHRHGGMTRMAGAVSQKRLAAADKILKLIGQLPAEEPPVDLVAKTMDRIDRATAGRLGNAARRAPIAPTPPVA